MKEVFEEHHSGERYGYVTEVETDSAYKQVLLSAGALDGSPIDTAWVSPMQARAIAEALIRAADEVETLAHTGRPSRAPMRIASAAAFVTTLAALGFVVAPDAQAPEYPLLKDVVSAPVMTPSPNSPSPYKPEPQPATHTDRDEERKTLTPSPSPTIAKPSSTPATKRPGKTPADIRISFYRDCTGDPQPCIDAGSLTMYAGHILAGHNYDGYAWLSRVPVGRTVRVISGPLAGTYRVYGHQYIDRQGGAIPTFSGGPDLVLQTCEGDGTGFSLLRRV
ncbi:hypothetical protein [Streptomyces sp. SID5910]|uniref:hypothetical protein n=1 Tax=Streptomyces sp. SID5910 TaxID=2690312 RepID=UPI00137092E2|nr:hypothetical protein [Streptomyces sp. SID5910]MYR43120.1 hypothetical protein [Streptomyces sp. SID5910]